MNGWINMQFVMKEKNNGELWSQAAPSGQACDLMVDIIASYCHVCLYPSALCCFNSCSLYLYYLSQLEFSDDIVRIIQTAINNDGGQPESRKANSMVKSFFIRVRTSNLFGDVDDITHPLCTTSDVQSEQHAECMVIIWPFKKNYFIILWS